jgi:DNA-directed RNA polymerase subunit RPC12/RpoP
MRLDLKNGLPDALLAKIRMHSEGIDDLDNRAMPCHYCGHRTIDVFADACGHIKAKCRKCGKEAIYNVILRRRKNRALTLRVINL